MSWRKTIIASTSIACLLAGYPYAVLSILHYLPYDHINSTAQKAPQAIEVLLKSCQVTIWLPSRACHALGLWEDIWWLYFSPGAISEGRITDVCYLTSLRMWRDILWAFTCWFLVCGATLSCISLTMHLLTSRGRTREPHTGK